MRLQLKSLCMVMLTSQFLRNVPIVVRVTAGALMRQVNVFVTLDILVWIVLLLNANQDAFQTKVNV